MPKDTKYLDKLSDEDLINLGWSLNNEVGLILQELEFVKKLKEDVLNDLTAIAEREEGLNVIKKYIDNYVKSK